MAKRYVYLNGEKLKGVMIATFQNLKGCHREEDIDLFSTALQVGQEANFLKMRTIKQWTLTEVFIKRLDNHLSEIACFGQRIGLEDLEVPSQRYDSMKS